MYDDTQKSIFKIYDRDQNYENSEFYEHTNCERLKQHLCGQATTRLEQSYVYDDTQKSIFEFNDRYQN